MTLLDKFVGRGLRQPQQMREVKSSFLGLFCHSAIILDGCAHASSGERHGEEGKNERMGPLLFLIRHALFPLSQSILSHPLKVRVQSFRWSTVRGQTIKQMSSYQTPSRQRIMSPRPHCFLPRSLCAIFFASFPSRIHSFPNIFETRMLNRTCLLGGGLLVLDCRALVTVSSMSLLVLRGRALVCATIRRLLLLLLAILAGRRCLLAVGSLLLSVRLLLLISTVSLVVCHLIDVDVKKSE